MQRLVSLWFSVAAVALLGGCAPVPQPMFIQGFYTLDPGCAAPTTPEDAVTMGGTLDIALQGTPSFHIAVQVAGAAGYAQPAVTLSGGQVLEPENRNRPILDRVVLSYAAKPTSFALKLDSAQLSRAIQLTSDGTAMIAPINLITPQVADELTGRLATGDEVELQVSVEVKGYMSGDRSAVTTGPLVFPIRVIMSDLGMCTTPRQLVAGTCPYPGQSTSVGSPVVCCDGQLTGTLTGCP